MMRVLVTGAGGQIGTELVALFAGAGHGVTAATSATLDVTDRATVVDAVRALAPAVVVNTAAWTDVDGCEHDPDRAERVNGRAVGHLVEAAEDVGAQVCHLSTDYVFDGRKTGPYVEGDRPNPLSVYGRSKLAGERHLRPEDLLIRTAWVSGLHGRNVVTAVLRQVELREELHFVDDQLGSPTMAADLAGKVVELAEARAGGTFHVTNQGAATWYEVARAVVVALGLDPARLRPVPTAELDPPRPAARPANSVLDNARLRADGIALLPHWRERLPGLVAAMAGRR